jgi:cysteine desulfurase family protein (TIGR01976 family)
MSQPTLNLDFVRSQFPAFDEPSLDGWAFFENAGGSYASRQTIDRLHNYYKRTKVQPYGPYPAAATAGKHMDDAHIRLAGIMNVGVDEVHIGPSTSQNTYVLAHAFRAGWEEGDEIIVTNQDHEANTGVWRRLADVGIVVKEWQVDSETGMLDLADLKALISDRTRLAAFPHCSNIVAHINPVAEICAILRASDVVSVVDGVAAAPHGLPDIAALGADIYLFSAYKTWGPHQGVMTVRRSVCDSLANQSHWFNENEITKRLIPAGPDHAQVAAMNGVVDYIDAIHEAHFDDGAAPDERGRRVRELMRAHEIQLLTPLLDFLAERSDIRLLGPADPSIRVPTVALVPSNNPHEIAKALVEHKIMADAGDFYGVRVIEAMGVAADPGVLRVSFVHYTSPAEVDQLINALDATL